MFRIRFYCGGLDMTGKVVSPVTYKTVMSKAFSGFTMFQAEGSWGYQAEPSYVFEVVIGAEPHNPDKIAHELARVGNQTEVMVTVEIVNCYFVSGGKAD